MPLKCLSSVLFPLAAIYYLTSVSLLSQIKNDFTAHTDMEAGTMKGSSHWCDQSVTALAAPPLSISFCALLTHHILF